MNWTEQQFADCLRRRGLAGAPPVVDTSIPPFLPPANDAGAFARGKPKASDMNKTEAKYAAYLEAQKLAGDVLWWGFECIKLRLADNTFYTPDFLVLKHDLALEVHETKGFWRDDARVKIKVAAEHFPFKFLAVTKDRDGWQREEFA